MTLLADNKLEVLKRKPSDLVRYIKWSKETKANYDSITKYICQERLRWKPLPTSSDDGGLEFEFKNPTPFADPDDYKILPNDWPYSFAPGIIHIVVWLKNRIPTDQSGDVTKESRCKIEDFVKKTFVDVLRRDYKDADDMVQWFKNWVSLQSVRSMEHFHVLVRDVPGKFLVEWTGEEGPRQ